MAKRYTDAREFDRDNFRRYLSNRRYMSLRFGSVFVFGVTMIETLLSVLYGFNIGYTIVLGTISAIAMCISLYATFTFMFGYKTYQDKTDVTGEVFPSKILIFIKYTILTIALLSLVISVILISLSYNTNLLVILLANIATVTLSIAMYINLTKMIKEQDRYLQLSQKLSAY